ARADEARDRNVHGRSCPAIVPCTFASGWPFSTTPPSPSGCDSQCGPWHFRAVQKPAGQGRCPALRFLGFAHVLIGKPVPTFPGHALMGSTVAASALTGSGPAAAPNPPARHPSKGGLSS